MLVSRRRTERPRDLYYSLVLVFAWTCYVEPRYIIDPDNGLFVGLQGHGFMLAQYLAKLYVDKALGRTVPDYMERLRLDGDGISEKAFK